MKRILFMTQITLIIFFNLVSLAFSEETEIKERQIPVVKCSAPTYFVTVMEFDCKANACQQANPGTPQLAFLYEMLSGTGGVKGFGKGLTTMLTNALKETNCFNIVDLGQYEQIKKMMEATGQKVQPPKVDYIITGAITALELERSGGALGGGFIPILGAINMKKDKAKLGVEINVLKPKTLEVILSKSFNANSEQTSWGLFGGGVGGGGVAGGGWNISKNLSLDMVAREVVVQVANSIAESFVPDKIIERPKPPKEEKKQEEEKSQK